MGHKPPDRRFNPCGCTTPRRSRTRPGPQTAPHCREGQKAPQASTGGSNPRQKSGENAVPARSSGGSGHQGSRRARTSRENGVTARAPDEIRRNQRWRSGSTFRPPAGSSPVNNVAREQSIRAAPPGDRGKRGEQALRSTRKSPIARKGNHTPGGDCGADRRLDDRPRIGGTPHTRRLKVWRFAEIPREQS